MRRHSHRWADVGGLESSWRESLDWLQGLRTKMCLGAATQKPLWSDQGTGRKSKSRGNNLRSPSMCGLSEKHCPSAHVQNTITTTWFSVDPKSHKSRWKLWHCFRGIFGSAHAATQLLIFAVSSYSYLQYSSTLYTVFQVGQAICSRPFGLSCLAALLAVILIHSSDCPSLCCTAVQERRTARALHFSLAQVSTQEIATQILFEIQWVRTPWSLKAKVTASDG